MSFVHFHFQTTFRTRTSRNLEWPAQTLQSHFGWRVSFPTWIFWCAISNPHCLNKWESKQVASGILRDTWYVHMSYIYIYMWLPIYKIYFDKNNAGTSTTCFWPQRNQERTESIESKSGTQIRNSLVPEKVLMIHRVLIWKRLLFVLLLDRHKAACALGVWCRFDPTKRWP